MKVLLKSQIISIKNLPILLIILFVVQGIIYSGMYPLWDPWDEPPHFAYLQHMIEKKTLPLTPLGSALFWFTTKDQISLENPAWILEPIWVLGHANHYDPDKSFSEQEKHSLLEFTP